MDESPPRTDTERELAAVWARVLPVSHVDRHQHFFRSGGDSLLATLVVVHLRKSLDVEITSQLLFAWPVLADLAHQIDLLQARSPR